MPEIDNLETDNLETDSLETDSPETDSPETSSRGSGGKRPPARSADGSRTFGPLLNVGLSVGAVLVALVLRVLGKTYRIRIVSGEETMTRVASERKPVLLTFWHNSVFTSVYFILVHLCRRDFPVTLLSSYSRDGELAARTGRLFGFNAIRGSASHGGSGALRRLYRAITRDGSSPITIPDGPHGPIYKCKPGIVVLAELSGAPFLPLAFHSTSTWRLSSWDRLFVPKPFARVSVAVGEPFLVPNSQSQEELESQMRRVEEILNLLGEEVRRGHAGTRG